MAALRQPGAAIRAHAILGPRQVGKTTLALQVIDSFLDAGWPAGRLLYFDFSDPLLTTAVAIESVLEQMPPGDGPRLLVFDEVTQAPHWGRSVKSIVDRARRRGPAEVDHVLVLDSSASVLRDDATQELEGRVVEHKIEGLDYASFLHRIARDDESLDQVRRRIPDPLARYVSRGGMPGISDIEDAAEARALLRSDVVEKAIGRDVARGGEDALRIRRLFTYLGRSSGSQVRAKEIADALRSDGGDERLDPRTAQNWIDKLAEVGLLQLLDPWKPAHRSEKAQSQLAKIPKAYVFDHGLVSALDPSPSPLDRAGVLGIVHETMIFRSLRAIAQRGKNIRLGYLRLRDDYELDFVVDNGTAAVGVEVTSSIDGSSKLARALVLAERFKLRRIVVVHGGRQRVTHEHADEIGVEEFLLDAERIILEALS